MKGRRERRDEKSSDKKQKTITVIQNFLSTNITSKNCLFAYFFFYFDFGFPLPATIISKTLYYYSTKH